MDGVVWGSARSERRSKGKERLKVRLLGYAAKPKGSKIVMVVLNFLCRSVPPIAAALRMGDMGKLSQLLHGFCSSGDSLPSLKAEKQRGEAFTGHVIAYICCIYL